MARLLGCCLLKQGIVAAGIAAGIAVTAPAFAQKWDMPVRSNPQNYMTKNIIQFTEDVKKSTDGKLNIVIHTEDSLVKQPDVKRAVQTGQVPLGELLMSMHSNEKPIYGIDTIPFLTTNYGENAKLLEAARPLLTKVLDQQRLKLLFVVPWPYNSYYSQKSLSSVKDLAGTKFRAFNPTTGRLAELMGATPVTVQQSEVSQAFSTGVIDAMITSPATGVDTQAWDFVKYFTDVRAMAPWNIVVVNKKAFADLDEATQDAVLKAADAAEKRGWEWAPQETDKLIKTLADHGITVEEPTEQLKADLGKIHETLMEEWLSRAGPEVKEVIEQYRQAK